VSTASTPPPLEPVTDRESPFERIADYVSAAMGRPTNIMVWLVLVIGWTVMFASGLVNPAGTFLPRWFTSEGFNFPLNLVTTVAELFIGFLVAAASNRSERNLNRTLAAISAQEKTISEVEDRLADSLEANTALTQQVHGLAEQIHAHITTPAVLGEATAGGAASYGLDAGTLKAALDKAMEPVLAHLAAHVAPVPAPGPRTSGKR
jgi:low affinity Fe/Cu permease